MDNYAIYCTQEQAMKALELGAPIIQSPEWELDNNLKLKKGKHITLVIPTAEQMIGWLEEQKNITIEISRQYGINKYCYYVFDNYGNDIENIESKIRFSSRKEATISAIDAAIEYLVTNNLIK